MAVQVDDDHVEPTGPERSGMNGLEMRPVTHLIVHQGALGDWLLAMRLCESLAGVVGFATTTSRASAFERLYPGRVIFFDIDSPGFRRIYSDGSAVDEKFSRWASQITGVVVGFVGHGLATSTSDWLSNARAIFLNATCVGIEPAGAQEPGEHVTAWHVRRLGDFAPGVITKAERFEPIWSLVPGAKVVVHPGSGGRSKRWPLERFTAMSHELERMGYSVNWVVGEDDLQLDDGQELQAALARWQGSVVDTLPGLMAACLSARLWVGNDSGPSHLAGMLGTPVLTLFGPTDARVWSPVGVRVRVIAPEVGVKFRMDWLGVDRVVEEAVGMLKMWG